MRNEPGWFLSGASINYLQDESIVELVRIAKAAHFVNVRVRINGEWKEFEADWIKHLKPKTAFSWREAIVEGNAGNIGLGSSGDAGRAVSPQLNQAAYKADNLSGV